jgi:hypothetical protein
VKTTSCAQVHAELAYAYSSPHDRKFVIQRLERIESGMVVVYFKVIGRHFSGPADKKHVIQQ